MIPGQGLKSPIKKEKENVCRISIKRKKDGTLVKEISGDCSQAQLKALSDQKVEDNE